ncbi:LytR/AlgR family response regulator transcription factor [Aureivirga marina]|uniref:LytR/AlgR family response regulator transcription factor n=1 Tax=Aureivirga marina TaxID=1182451 RepID=UPI0018C8DBE3|nr:LytTR family DNA-binding domain-containing protein [Aureivirga marina]
MNFSYLILDDNLQSSNELISKMELFSNYLCVGKTQSNDEFLELMLSKNPQIVFYNIDSESIEKFQFIRELQHFNNIQKPEIIVYSSSKEYAYEAIKLHVKDYLLRPLKIIDLKKALNKFEENHIVNDSLISVKSYHNLYFLEKEEISYVKADGKTSDFVLGNKRTIVGNIILKEVEKRLPMNSFIRVHNSYIINVNHISRIDLKNSYIKLKNDLRVPFSRTYKKNINRIKEYFSVGNLYAKAV